MTEVDFKIVKLSQASDLAKTISNKTAQTIIEHIGEKKKITASHISKNLKLPASTVHYNLKALVKAGIVDDKEFTYSEKGKTIIHYSLTNNILIILPQGRDEFSLVNSIKSLVPSLIGVGVLGVAYTLFSKKFAQSSNNTLLAATLSASSQVSPFELDSAASKVVAQETFTDEMAKSLPDIITQSTSPLIPDFLWGVLIATLLIVIIFLTYSYFNTQRRT